MTWLIKLYKHKLYILYKWTHLIPNFSQTWKYQNDASLVTPWNNQKKNVWKSVCFMVGHNCDRWDNVYTEIKLFLQSSKFLYISAQLLTHYKRFHHIIWLLLYIKTLIQHWIGLLRYKKNSYYPSGQYCCHQHVYSFYVHTQQNWIIVNSYINTRHLTYINSLLFCFAVIVFSRCKQEVICSGHVTICTDHVKLHIFNWDPLYFPYLQKMH